MRVSIVPCLTFLALPIAVSTVSLAGPSLSLQDDAQEQYQFLTGLAEKGLHDMVVREATAFLRDHSGHPKANLVRYRLANAHYEQGKHELARKELSALTGVRNFEFAGEVAFRLGQCELEREEFGSARAAFERVVETDAKYLHAPATFLRAEAGFRDGDFADAESWYQKLGGRRAPEGADEYAADAGYGLAWCAFRLGRHDDTVARVQSFLGRWPEDGRRGELAFLAGEAHLEADRPSDALEAYRVVPEGPFHDAALRGQGFAHVALEQPAEAAASFRALVEQHPDSRFVSEAAVQGGIQLLAAGDPVNADALLASKAAGGGPEVLFWRARAAADQDHHAAALKLLERALQKEPEDELRARLEVARGDALFDLGRKDEAAAAYESAGSDYARHAAAVAQLTEGNPAEAERLVRPLAERGDGKYRMEARLTLAEALFALERFDEARPFFADVAKNGADDPEKARAGAREAWCLYRMGQNGPAAQRFARVARDYPDSEVADEALFLAARAHEEAGAMDDAARTYAAYVKAHPEGERAVEAGLRLARFEGGEAGRVRLANLVDRSSSTALAPQVRYDLAEGLAAEGKHEEAAPHYRAILQNHPDHELCHPAAYGLAWSLYEAGDASGSTSTLITLLKQQGLTPELRVASLELALFATRQSGEVRRVPGLAQELFAATSDEPRRLAAARVAADALRQAGDLDGARNLYGELLRTTQDGSVAVAVCIERSYLALDQGVPQDAEKELRAAVPYAQNDPALAEAFFFLGEAWFDQGEDELAVAAYGTCLPAAEPAVRARALYKAGFAELRRENFAPAAVHFQNLATDHPEDELAGEALFLAGESHFRAGQHAQAIPPLEGVLKDHPRHAVVPKVLFRLGLAYGQEERWKSARETLSTLSKKHPDFEARDEAELWRGRALAQLGERRAAESALKGVVQRDKGVLSARARIALGLLAQDSGELDDALSEYLKVAVLYAHEEEVGEALFRAGQVLEAQEDAVRARAQYSELLERCPKSSFAPAARERLSQLPR